MEARFILLHNQEASEKAYEQAMRDNSELMSLVQDIKNPPAEFSRLMQGIADDILFQQYDAAATTVREWLHEHVFKQSIDVNTMKCQEYNTEYEIIEASDDIEFDQTCFQSTTAYAQFLDAMEQIAPECRAWILTDVSEDLVPIVMQAVDKLQLQNDDMLLIELLDLEDGTHKCCLLNA